MTDRVRRQYEAYPYPDRDPADEARRLITGSPSDPHEIDHYLFGGARDWSRPFRALVAGGGTGDGLIQLAQGLAWAGVPHEITYLDLSRAARKVARARARARGLSGIRWVTGSLLDAADLGPFEYIDCCGVLHHLPDPAAGAAALRAALAPGGGAGLMVYAPLGRSGVYPLQAAFRSLFGHLPETRQVSEARALIARLPEGHPFRRNPHLGDHRTSDAGFFDLLLHSQDRAYAVDEVLELLAGAGLGHAAPLPAALYDPARFGAEAPGLEGAARMAVAEQLDGTMKVHIVYAAPTAPPARDPGTIPHLRLPAGRAAEAVAQTGQLSLRIMGRPTRIALPRAAAPLLARIDGVHSAAEIGGTDPLWTELERTLAGWNLLHRSALPPPG